MAFRSGAWAKVWSISPKEHYTEVRISTSKKKRDSDEYEQDFGGFVRLIGKANEKASQLEVNGRFKITDCCVTNSYNKDTKVTYNNFCIFDIEFAEDAAQQDPAQTQTDPTTNPNYPGLPPFAEENGFIPASDDIAKMYNGF